MDKRVIINEEDDQWFFHDPPRSLTPKEREAWKKDAEWERGEYERRMKQGLYPNQKLPQKKSRGWKLIQKLFGMGIQPYNGLNNVSI